ncbi:CYTH and CHAD domain-containing protein [Micromonospora sp. WMMD998]|uniref:CYTH and CHAD domain-containing protein n=1 Tax=Micromonospora sp. WMMD998 TaxID=3016092 RepID=UPI00249B6EFB|nr:CYTH and CHAD domain-containing protein [Micromonospora sp. WMMD998]WFE38485.1 CYTH and CHAD domain-containing protein [Micromonospora sp. WMMD998]
MGTVVERERKFSGDDGFRLPDLAGCGGVATVSDATALELDAVYWDTDDLRLLRSGHALRRRTGGHDAGWHLKVGAVGGARVEHQFPAGASDAGPPAELVALIRGASRGRPVAPAARIVNHRRERRLLDSGGRVLAEVAEDDVRSEDLVDGTTQSWHEVEVELIDGDEDLLDAVAARLSGAGAREVPVSKSHRAVAHRLARVDDRPPADAAGPVIGYAREQRDTIVANHAAAYQGDEDAVHDMRVAVRRLRATLRTFRGLWARRESEAARAELRWLGGELGAVRDHQVMAARLAAAMHELPDELVLGPVAARIGERFAADLAKAITALRAALDSDRYPELLTRLDRLLDGTAGEVDGRWTDRRIRRAVRRADERLDRALAGGGPAGDAALHEARKKYKAARYAVEVRQAAAGKPAARLVKRFKRLQDLLGTHQDSVVTREVLLRHALRAYAEGENTFTYGLLHARQAETAGHDLPAVLRARDRARRRRVRRWLTR